MVAKGGTDLLHGRFNYLKELGEGGDADSVCVVFEGHAPLLAVGDDKLAAVDFLGQLFGDDGFDIAEPIAGRQLRLRCVDANEIRLGVFGDQVVAKLRVVDRIGSEVLLRHFGSS